MEVAPLLIVSDDGFLGAVERETFALGSRTELGDIIEAEHHVLRRDGNRRTVGRIEDIVALEHQNLRLQNSLIAQGEMDGHLVTVEVGVERRTCQRMQLDGLALDELRLESLNTKTVKSRGAVQHDRMTFHHILEDVPDDWLTTIHDFLGALDCLHDTALDELADDERLVKLGRHQLRQAALAHLQLRPDNDYGTGRVVDTLAEEVLTETSLLALQGVRERLQGTIALALHSR